MLKQKEKKEEKQTSPTMSEADIKKRLEEFSAQIIISEKAADSINGLLVMFDNQKDKITEKMDDFFLQYIRCDEYDVEQIEEAFYAYNGIVRLVRDIEFVNTPKSSHLKKLYHVED